MPTFFYEEQETGEFSKWDFTERCSTESRTLEMLRRFKVRNEPRVQNGKLVACDKTLPIFVQAGRLTRSLFCISSHNDGLTLNKLKRGRFLVKN